ADGRRLAINILVAFLPAAVLGPFVHETIARNLFHGGPVLAAPALGGVFMIALDRWRLPDRGHANGARAGGDAPSPPDADAGQPGLTRDRLTGRGALIIGVMQAVAMWPGSSR